MFDYDLIVLGGGSGGLVAARVAAALGGKVALVDKTRLGGDCLYTGCVPSKTLIEIANATHQARQAAARGIITAPLQVDMARVAATIAGVIVRVGVEEQVYVQDVDVRFGQATFIDPRTLNLDGTPLTSKSFIIATGSRPSVPPIAGLAEVGYYTNEDLFDLAQLPPSLIVLGGGAIGCEMAQAFARLGAQVTVIELLDRLLVREEPETSQVIHEALVADGVRVLTGAKVTQVRQEGDAKVVSGMLSDGLPFTTQGAALLVAVGRAPNTEALGLERAGVQVTPKGLAVDVKMRTNVPHIFAIGDVVAGNLLFTHVAAAQGGVAGPNALLPGLLMRRMRADVVPWVTFTDPEAARVGLTEAEARQQFGDAVRVQTLPWGNIDRAQAEGATAGFIKLVLGKKDRILGAHLVGAHAGEVLGEVTLAMRHGLGVNAIIATIHAYPTLTTGLQQAAFEAYLTSSGFASSRRLVNRLLPKRAGG